MKKHIAILTALCLIILAGCEITPHEKPNAPDTYSEEQNSESGSSQSYYSTDAPEPLHELKRDSLPIDFIGHTLLEAEKIFGTAGGGFPCADGGTLNYWEDSIEKVYFSTHDNSGDSNAVFKTVYCSAKGINLTPGLAAGEKYDKYKESFPELSDCEYDRSSAYYRAGFDTVKDGEIPLHIYLYFYTPEDTCSGIIITSEELKASISLIDANERGSYALFTLNRSYKDAVAKYKKHAFDYGDYDTPQAKSLILAGINYNPIEVSAGDTARVKTVSISSEDLPVLPGIRCGMNIADLRKDSSKYISSSSPLAYGTVQEVNDACEEFGSVYCSTIRIGAMNVECYCAIDSNGILTQWDFLAKSTY